MKEIIEDLKLLCEKHGIEIIGEGFIYKNGVQIREEVIIVEEE